MGRVYRSLEGISENILNRVIIVNLKFIQISLNEFVIN